jgi:hypothetical protein
MFGELPKLLGKTFLIGYLLPVALTLIVGAAILDAYANTRIYAWALQAIGSADEKQLAFQTGLALAIAWMGGIILLSINYNLIRILEGYGRFNPAYPLKYWSLKVFNDLSKEHNEIEAQRQDGKTPAHLRSAHSRVRYRLGNEFPETESLLLPTRFGNIFRAFERYPQVIYSIDAIHTWPRIQALIPKSYGALLNDAKAQLDFLVNLWFGFSLLAIGTATLFVYSRSFSLMFPFIAAIILAVFSAKLGQIAAAQWGVLVKGAFDLYRGDLCKQLGFNMPRSIKSERQMWTAVSQTFLYRRPEYADKSTRFRSLIGEKNRRPR